jgi:putative two-component system response regulator
MSLKPRILYVDDDVANCEMMTYWLREECGYDVTPAIDGKGAIALIESEFFDLYLLDYCLPDMTAINLCEKIRELNAAAPIMIYSALDREVDQQRAFKAGANHYLMKPDQMSLIKPEVDRLLGGMRKVDAPVTAGAAEHRTIVHKVSHKRVRSSGIV